MSIYVSKYFSSGRQTSLLAFNNDTNFPKPAVKSGCDWFVLYFVTISACSQSASLAMPGKVVVYGGKGGLGHVVVENFKRLGYWVLSVDIVEQPSADHNVLVSLDASWTGQETQVTEGVGAALNVSHHVVRAPSCSVLSRGPS